ncbi:MAG: hypothetical protein IJU98_05560 [Synergistaceae bacterium]|nr:hypothetical protein [Synergistaceae bacterium]
MAGIIRWLERFQNSYRVGALENALMDAECARADIEDLRLTIWSRVSPTRGRRHTWGTVVYGAVSTLLIVLATAVPLSKSAVLAIPAVSVAVSEASEPSKIKEKVTADPATGKKRKLGAPRKGIAVAKKTAPARPVSKTIPAQAAVRPAEKKVPYDEVFPLLQMGARALKNEESVIKVRKIEKGEGKL